MVVVYLLRSRSGYSYRHCQLRALERWGAELRDSAYGIVQPRMCSKRDGTTPYTTVHTTTGCACAYVLAFPVAMGDLEE